MCNAHAGRLAPSQATYQPAAEPSSDTYLSSNFRGTELGHIYAGRSPARQLSEAPSFHDRSRAPTPAQLGVTYDANERPLPPGTVGIVGPQTSAQGFEKFKQEQRAKYPGISDENILRNWQIAKGDDTDAWARNVQKS